jgi:hypothetical protein
MRRSSRLGPDDFAESAELRFAVPVPAGEVRTSSVMLGPCSASGLRTPLRPCVELCDSLVDTIRRITARLVCDVEVWAGVPGLACETVDSFT